MINSQFKHLLEFATGLGRRALFHWRNVPPMHHSCEQAPDDGEEGSKTPNLTLRVLETPQLLNLPEHKHDFLGNLGEGILLT